MLALRVPRLDRWRRGWGVRRGRQAAPRRLERGGRDDLSSLYIARWRRAVLYVALGLWFVEIVRISVI